EGAGAVARTGRRVRSARSCRGLAATVETNKPTGWFQMQHGPPVAWRRGGDWRSQHAAGRQPAAFEAQDGGEPVVVLVVVDHAQHVLLRDGSDQRIDELHPVATSALGGKLTHGAHGDAPAPAADAHLWECGKPQL